MRFHNLRREAGSRLIDGLLPAQYVQEFLGHADLTTTSTYLAITRTGMHQVMKQYEQRRNESAPTPASKPSNVASV